MDEAYVLDSFALIAHLEAEARGVKVTEILKRAQIKKGTGKIGSRREVAPPVPHTGQIRVGRDRHFFCRWSIS